MVLAIIWMFDST